MDAAGRVTQAEYHAALDRRDKRIVDLEALVSEMHGSGLRFSFDCEVYIQGIRVGPGDYVLMRIGPATADEHPF